MKAFRLIGTGVLAVATGTLLVWQHRLRAKLRQENDALRLRIEQVQAVNDEPSRTANPPTHSQSVSDEQLRELIRLRGEVSTLRRQQDDLRKQLATKATPAPGQDRAADAAWVQQILNSAPKDQGIAAGALRGKLLRREMTNVSPAELALQEELLKLQINQRLERSPVEFADFQTAFVQAALGISDEARVQQIHDVIQRTYEQAVANGLDIPSKPLTGTDEWVQRRFILDRAATTQVKEVLTPEERTVFDRAFLGIMGVDLGGVGVDKSNYPKGFIAE